ncbi:hypothetical protein HY750_03835 [Candidatus Kuenenbacteria bacterium]|nr:hypothetical protein [Candidatus Kuenenbacteria bacterium]
MALWSPICIWHYANVTRVKEPIIYLMNKNEIMVKNFSCFNKIKNRKNVLLLGDSLDDIDMIEGFDYDNLIKIGFLDYDVANNLKQYKKNYDIIILNDGPMDFVNELLRKITLKMTNDKFPMSNQ